MTWRDADFLKLLESKVLVIGAGGIGCELLKNLALTGLKNITVVDLDTIDISNLNRQFLFRKEHVGKSKAEVAAGAVKSMCPGVNITHYHDSVLSENFGVDFFKQHVLVMSALDNRAARSHVNRLCLVAGVPLIESGSTGYLGQVSVIIKGKTECYDCSEKQAQKTYPSCTIRNTPSELIHCVVWAKSLFNQLFGEADPDDDVSPELDDDSKKDLELTKAVADSHEMDTGEENGKAEEDADGAQAAATTTDDPHSMDTTTGEENGNAGEDADGAKAVATATNNADGSASEGPKRVSTRAFAEKHAYSPALVFNKLFHDDICYLLKMADLWKDRKKPRLLNYERLVAGDAPGPSRELTSSDNWGVGKWLEVYDDSIEKLFGRYKECAAKASGKGGGVLAWDKDDEPAMNFVAACSNIRAYVFQIPMKSLFEVKSMAGNIIPAIATTNACVAGMIVVEALKILRGDLDQCKSVFITRAPNPRGKILVDENKHKPNPNCYVCSDKGEVILQLNIDRMSVKTFRDAVLLGGLGMRAPDVMDLFTHRILISSEEGETDALLESTLGSLGVLNGAQFDVDDFAQQLHFKIVAFNNSAYDQQQFSIEKRN